MNFDLLAFGNLFLAGVAVGLFVAWLSFCQKGGKQTERKKRSLWGFTGFRYFLLGVCSFGAVIVLGVSGIIGTFFCQNFGWYLIWFAGLFALASLFLLIKGDVKIRQEFEEKERKEVQEKKK